MRYPTILSKSLWFNIETRGVLLHIAAKLCQAGFGILMEPKAFTHNN
jgi:hypothetical protein